MNTSQIVSSAVTGALFTQVGPTSANSLEELGFSVLGAVLAAILTWLSGRRPSVK